MAEIRSNQPTAQSVIESAMRLIGVIARGQSASAEEQKYGLATLNDMIESWNLQRVLIYETSRELCTLAANKNPHTIGLAFDGGQAGDFNIARPPNIQGASLIQLGTNTELAIRILSKEQYQRIPNKGTVGTYPNELWYEREWPLGKIHLYPVPAEASQLVLYIWKQLDSGLALTDKFKVPPGYLRAIRFNLAVELASEFGMVASKEVSRIAMESKAAIASLNNDEPSYMEIDPSLTGIGVRSGYNIRSGEFQ